METLQRVLFQVGITLLCSICVTEMLQSDDVNVMLLNHTDKFGLMK